MDKGGDALPEEHRVLLVEDQPTIAEWVRTALSAEDVALFSCSDGRAALEAARAVGPSVILQDLVLPNVDGFELLAQYAATPELAGVPVIVLSSVADVLEKARAFSLGAVDYVTKFPHPIELLARVRAQSRAYLARRERDRRTHDLHRTMQALSESNAVLARVAREDGLTGLANRRALDEALEVEWRRGMREGRPLSLALIDLDFFKLYNDRYGHVRGDECLRTVGDAVRACARRPGDLAARYGGEELGLLLPGTAAEGARELGEQVREAVRALELPHEARTDALRQVTASVGVGTLVPSQEVSARKLVEAADSALYRAKRSGRDRVVHASLG